MLFTSESSFGALYCASRKIGAEKYETSVLAETLYPHARLLTPVLRFVWPRHFTADYDFVQSVARLERFRDFFNEAEDFSHHPDNVGFSRVTLNLRVSSRRMRRLVREVLHPELIGSDKALDSSIAPFNAGPEKDAPGATPPNAESGPA